MSRGRATVFRCLAAACLGAVVLGSAGAAAASAAAGAHATGAHAAGAHATAAQRRPSSLRPVGPSVSPTVRQHLSRPGVHSYRLSAVRTVARRASPPDFARWWRGRTPLQRATRVTSTNWAGYVDTGTGFTGVSGEWTVPTVSRSTGTKIVATWLGVGGGVTSTSSLAQTGTEIITQGGTITYAAFVEVITTGVTVGNFTVTPRTFPVRPGDSVSAVVTEVSSGTWHIAFEDATQGWTVTTTLHLAFTTGQTAEWITERPLTGISGRLTALANFGSTHFDHLHVDARASVLALDASYMLATTGRLLAYPGPFSTATTGNFTDFYNGTASPPGTTSSPPPRSTNAPPSVTSVSPPTGPTAGGTTVTIVGSHLTGATAVTFGTTAATTFKVTGTTRVTATSPPGSGSVDVTVTTPRGTSATSSADKFTFVSPSNSRIFGSTAAATAAAEMEHQFPATNGACPGTTGSRPVVLATDAAYPDALASAYLARYLGTGTLLTAPSSLSPATLTAIHKEGVTKVYVVGGPLAVSTAVVNALKSVSADTCGGTGALPGPVHVQVTRIAGPTQYDTAEKIAELPPSSSIGAVAFPGAYAGSNNSGGNGRYNATSGLASSAPPSSTALRTAIVATGKSFQDAESASTMAYAERFPILLTSPATLSSQASSAISALGIRQVVVMGGPLAISNGVVSALESLGVSALRVAGGTYSGTSTQLAEFETAAAGGGLGWAGTGSLAVANGSGFADGVAGAVVAADGPSATGPAPLVLTISPTVAGTALSGFVHTAGTVGFGGIQVTHLTILGGPLALTTTTVSALEADL